MGSEIRRKKTGYVASRLSRSLNVNGTDADGSGIPDFLLTFPRHTVSKI